MAPPSYYKAAGTAASGRLRPRRRRRRAASRWGVRPRFRRHRRFNLSPPLAMICVGSARTCPRTPSAQDDEADEAERAFFGRISGGGEEAGGAPVETEKTTTSVTAHQVAEV